MGRRIKKIAMIGDGGWGTTLAIYLANKGYEVTLWGAFPEYVETVAKTRINQKYLPGFKIPAQVRITSDLSQTIASANLIVLATPSEYLTSTLQKIKNTDYKNKCFLSVVKGIHPQHFKTMSQIIHEELGQVLLAVLSGPTIASETAAGMVTTAVVASKNSVFATSIQKVFNSKTFRVYTNNDVLGVEIGGSIKNVIAIACGVCDGLKLGTNAKSAILTRGLAEIARLGLALGGKQETFYGLTGLGDLATTCFSPKSRNRSVGEALGQGKDIKSVLGDMHMVAEGVVTAKAVYHLSRKYRIPMPIVEQVYKIIFAAKSPKTALEDLMGRQAKAE